MAGGIPKRTCLGPLPFVLYVIAFELCSENCTSNMSMDDTSVNYFAGDVDELCNGLKSEVESITDWVWQNKLSLNTDKTDIW